MSHDANFLAYVKAKEDRDAVVAKIKAMIAYVQQIARDVMPKDISTWQFEPTSLHEPDQADDYRLPIPDDHSAFVDPAQWPTTARMQDLQHKLRVATDEAKRLYDALGPELKKYAPSLPSTLSGSPSQRSGRSRS